MKGIRTLWMFCILSVSFSSCHFMPDNNPVIESVEYVGATQFRLYGRGSWDSIDIMRLTVCDSTDKQSYLIKDVKDESGWFTSDSQYLCTVNSAFSSGQTIYVKGSLVYTIYGLAEFTVP